MAQLARVAGNAELEYRHGTVGGSQIGRLLSRGRLRQAGLLRKGIRHL